MLNVSANLATLFTRASHCYEADDLAQAEKLALQVLQLRPDHSGALHLLGIIALTLNLNEQAVDLLERTLALLPDDAAVHCNLAAALQNVGRVPEAITQYRLALALQPDLALALNNLAVLLSIQNHTDPAALASDPSCIPALNEMAARLAQSDPLLAIHVYDRSLDADPRQGAVLATLGRLYLQTHQGLCAADVLRSAIDVGYCTAEVFHDLAKALRYRFLDEALAAARSAAQLDPANVDVQWTITQILSEIHARDATIAKLRTALAAHPNSIDLKFQLAGLTDDVDLSTLPPTVVTGLFNGYAKTFESHLVERLHYRGHLQLFEAVTSVAPARRFEILDLGCGTGLCGVKFKPIASFIKGVDLAPAMIDKARTRGIYDELEAVDLVTALSRQTDRYDLIVAADVFEYVGNLEAVFSAAAAALRAGGLFAFSVERSDKPGFRFNRKSAAFAHSLEYLQDLAGRHGFIQAYAQERPLRVEGRTPLRAWIVVLQKPAPI